MTGSSLIEATRLRTYDTNLDKQTWTDARYLIALNAARSFLYANYPESRTTTTGGAQTYADLAEANLANDMWEDAMYSNFFVNYMAYLFFTADARNSRDASQAKEFFAVAMQSLRPQGR